MMGTGTAVGAVGADQLRIAGMTVTNDGTKTTFLGKTGDYIRIGDASDTAHGLNSEDDAMVTGEFEVDGISYLDEVRIANTLQLASGQILSMDVNAITSITKSTLDANAEVLVIKTAAGANRVPLLVNQIHPAVDLGLFDEVSQPGFAAIDENTKYTSSSSGTHDGSDLDQLTETGKFNNSVVGDIVRLVSGTNVTAGWYWITTVVGNDDVDLDRNFVTGGSASDVVYVAYHSFTMLSSEGVCTRITDGAPSDSSVEIDRDGWIILDVGNNRLYWRSQSAWKSVLPDGGVKSVVIPFVDGTAATSTGFDVDAESETAVAFGAIPAECNEVISIIIRGRAITTDGTNEMLLDIDVNGGADNEAYNVETYSADDIQSDTVPSANDDVVSWTVTDAGVVGAAGLSAGDTFIVLATGAPTDATDLATDCHFQSVEVKFK